MNYYVISPNVWNNGNFKHLLNTMCEEHCVLMGYDKDSDTGKAFSSLRKGDVVIVAQRHDWEFNYYFLGTVCKDETYYIEDAQCKYLNNFCLLTDDKTDFLKDWSAAGMRAMTAMVRIDPNKNQNVIKMIDKKLRESSMKENVKQYADLLTHTHNLILHGAPGTGKTHLAREIAEAMGCSDNEIGFVQFHPSYDYTDFVEGLRPMNDASSGQIGFERKDGVFKKFCERALEKYNTKNFDDAYDAMLESLGSEKKILKTSSGSEYAISVNTKGNLSLYTGENFQQNGVLTRESLKAEFTGMSVYKWWKGYYKGVVSYLEESFNLKKITNEKKNFVFIIDEINRGEMSKIFGELFFAIDPGYRGKDSLIQTQYQNLVPDGDTFSKGFYVPKNVYIIGTMNDIDRNVESMDFAFRRRFTFKEIKAKDTQNMLDKDEAWKNQSGETVKPDEQTIQEIKNRMDSLNKAISNIEGLSSAYHIGSAYFLKLKDLNNDFGLLWEYHLEGLLREYLRGMEDADSKLSELRKAYENKAVANQDESSNGQEQ